MYMCDVRFLRVAAFWKINSGGWINSVCTYMCLTSSVSLNCETEMSFSSFFMSQKCIYSVRLCK